MKINHIIGVLLALCILLSVQGCGMETQEVTKLTTEQTVQDTTQESTSGSTSDIPDTSFVPDEEHEVTKEELEDFLDHWVETYLSEDNVPSCRITVTGLCTPVVLEMEGVTVHNLLAYGRILPVEAGALEGYSELILKDWQDVLIVNREDDCWLMTPEEEFYFPCADGVSTGIHVDDEGQLTYGKMAVAANYMDQYYTFPLDSATDRGNLYSEHGSVAFRDGEPVLTMEERTLMGHVYDFDALFTMARVMGWADYEGCETADDVLRRNKEEADDWLTYPYEPREPAQLVEFEGLTLRLPALFNEEVRGDGILILRGADYAHEDVILKVTTGKTADGYQGVDEPITSIQQMASWDWDQRGSLNVADFSIRDVHCLLTYGDGVQIIRGYYLEGDRWWVIEVQDLWMDWLPTYATCGMTAN